MKDTKRILASAYACNPEPGGNIALFPGEAIGGWNLVRQIGRFGQVWVITHPRNREEIERAQARGEIPNVNFHYVALRRWANLLEKAEFGIRIYYYFWQIKALAAARKLHKEHAFDLAHHVTFNNDWMPSFIGAFLRVPFIWGPVGGGQRTPTAFRKSYSFGGSLAELSREAAQWIGRHLLISRRRCLKKARAVLVCNYETKAGIPERFQRKVHLFPVNGISREDLERVPARDLAHDGFRVLTAGRFIRLKAFDLGLRAFQRLALDHPDAVFELVGKGPEEEGLRDLVRELGIGDRVRFVPWLSKEPLMAKMAEADLFLFPSLRDGGGAVVVEAMAAGTPVICLDSGGPGFHVRPEYGIKVAAGDPDSAVRDMAAALEKLYADKDLRADMGRAAKARVLEFYVWERLGDRLGELYSEVLGPDARRLLEKEN